LRGDDQRMTQKECNMNIKFLFSLVFSCLFAIVSLSCPTCSDKGVVERRNACKECNGTGKITKQITSKCTTCTGDGKQSTSKKDGGLYQGSFCRPCKGTGQVININLEKCTPCDGKGVILSQLPCTICKSEKAPDNSDQPATGGTVATNRYKVAYVSAESCTQCDIKGKISHTLVCKSCEKGWYHKKTKEGTYTCVNCNGICDSRFSPCKCTKPDCLKCKGDYEKIVTETCPLCGGDKMITPLEREKFKKKEGAK
jgi:RecJ-like exonuclease